MKAVEWVRYLTDQRDRHGKGVFTVTELANVADATPAVLNVQLGRLVRQGLIRRWVTGRYGLPDGVTAEELAAAIDADAYVTAAAALARQGFITQQPREIDCFTRRRHNRSRRRVTPLGAITFVCVSPRIHAMPAGRSVSPPEQAICDLLYVLRRRGLDAENLYTFRKLDQIVVPPAVLARYPRTVQRAVESLLARAAADHSRRPIRRPGAESGDGGEGRNEPSAGDASRSGSYAGGRGPARIQGRGRHAGRSARGGPVRTRAAACDAAVSSGRPVRQPRKRS